MTKPKVVELTSTPPAYLMKQIQKVADRSGETPDLGNTVETVGGRTRRITRKPNPLLSYWRVQQEGLVSLRRGLPPQTGGLDGLFPQGYVVQVQLTNEERALLTENNEHVQAFLEAHEKTNGLLYNRVLVDNVTLGNHVTKDAG